MQADTLKEKPSEELSEDARASPTQQQGDIGAEQHPERPQVPQPPKDPPKPRATTSALLQKRNSSGEKNTGQGGPRFDAQGMVLPHSILGSLEDFRKEMEARGEMELVKQVPVLRTPIPPQTAEETCKEESSLSQSPEQDLQGRALQNWNYHMEERRRLQNYISQLLQKPVEDLLMNQSNQFRETQEQRELINKALSALYPGYGQHVGSEFWSLPVHLGDELSGIMTTLTQTERGLKQSTHISQPLSTRQEAGNVTSESTMSRAWRSSLYLKEQQHLLHSFLRDQNIKESDIEGLEVMGSKLPLPTQSVVCCPLLEDEKVEKIEEEQKENTKQPVGSDDAEEDEDHQAALRIGDEVARWTGSSTSDQEGVFVCVRLFFETVIGQKAFNDLDLSNEGNTAIYYNWEKLEQIHNFSQIRTLQQTQNFYFNTSSGVLLPGDTHRILVTFKNGCPGIRTEVWQLNTHPVLMGGASLQVILKGVALYQDSPGDQRAALEVELDHKIAVSACKILVCELLRGVRTPERARSPVPITEEELFNTRNPTLHYHHEPVEALKKLWEQAKASAMKDTSEEVPAWDLCMSSLRQEVLSLPQEDADPADSTNTADPADPANPADPADPATGVEELYREEALNQYNVLMPQLYRPQPPSVPITSYCIGLQLWRELLDDIATEALRLRLKLGLQETETWTETQSDEDSYEHTRWKRPKVEKVDRKVTPEKEKGKDKEQKKVSAKPAAKPAAKEKVAEGSTLLKNVTKDSTFITTDTETIESPPIEPEVLYPPELYLRYRRTLHRQVYVLVENFIGSLFDLLDKTPSP